MMVGSVCGEEEIDGLTMFAFTYLLCKIGVAVTAPGFGGRDEGTPRRYSEDSTRCTSVPCSTHLQHRTLAEGVRCRVASLCSVCDGAQLRAECHSRQPVALAYYFQLCLIALIV